MSASGNLAIPEDRPITEHEAAVVDWVLLHGTRAGPLDHLRRGIRDLRVVGRCGCGCASVDFVQGGQRWPAHPVAEAVGRDSRGQDCGLMVWVLDGRVSGLEVYESVRGSATEVPAIETLRPWEPAGAD